MNRNTEYKLLSCQNLSEFLAMFLGLGIKDKLDIFTEEVTITEGTELYRIRKIDDNHNPYDSKEWEPVPKEYANQGRFNSKGESVLYVASAPDCLEREVRLKENEDYYLARYVCKKTFNVGSFLGINNQVNTLINKIVMSVSGNDDMTITENKMMDEYYESAKDKSLFDLSLDKLAPLYIYRTFPKLYDATNKLGKLALKKNDNGIRYSSVFAPIELSGTPQIITLDGVEYGNYVLTQKGYNNIELESVDKKIAGKPQGLDNMIMEFAKATKEG